MMPSGMPVLHEPPAQVDSYGGGTHASRYCIYAGLASFRTQRAHVELAFIPPRTRVTVPMKTQFLALALLGLSSTPLWTQSVCSGSKKASPASAVAQTRDTSGMEHVQRAYAEAKVAQSEAQLAFARAKLAALEAELAAARLEVVVVRGTSAANVETTSPALVGDTSCDSVKVCDKAATVAGKTCDQGSTVAASSACEKDKAEGCSDKKAVAAADECPLKKAAHAAVAAAKDCSAACDKAATVADKTCDQASTAAARSECEKEKAEGCSEDKAVAAADECPLKKAAHAAVAAAKVASQTCDQAATIALETPALKIECPVALARLAGIDAERASVEAQSEVIRGRLAEVKVELAALRTGAVSAR